MPVNYNHWKKSWKVKKCGCSLVSGVQRGGRGEVECEREARSLGARRVSVDVLEIAFSSIPTPNTMLRFFLSNLAAIF